MGLFVVNFIMVHNYLFLGIFNILNVRVRKFRFSLFAIFLFEKKKIVIQI